MELVLDRRLSDRRVYPAFDIIKSGTKERGAPIEQKRIGKNVDT